jgi:hypothetical protein
MGGRERLAAIATVSLDVIGHTALAEQSYRQDPFITSYERDQISVDFQNHRILTRQHSVWPESDPKKGDSDAAFVVTPEGGTFHSKGGDSPVSGATLDSAQQRLALGPERLLLTAYGASDLKTLPSETLRSTEHTVIGFTWNSVPVRVLLNRFNHLPDAVETTQQLRDFWYFWGDVKQRVYFDNWRLVNGVEYPTNQVIERNGVAWRSLQALDVEINQAIDEKEFAADPKAAGLSRKAMGWNIPFNPDNHTQLAMGIDLFSGPWNATIVKQADGLVILEAPISGTFTHGLFDEAYRRYPGEKIKAILSTSDSWPHVGGIRYAVAADLPVYVLDLNRPVLERMVAAPHTIAPDDLEKTRRTPRWRVVSEKTEIGSGPNRILLYPLRGASTERQYMVYFPEHRLLYASDTLVLNSDHSLYDPELMSEVEQAVVREGLAVDTVFAMHEQPTPWSEVVALIQKSRT